MRKRSKIDAPTVKGEFIARNPQGSRYRFEIKLPTDAWYVRAINLPTAVALTNQQFSQGAASAAAKPIQSNPSQGIVPIEFSNQLSGFRSRSNTLIKRVRALSPEEQEQSRHRFD